jgi:tetratricopeptide (TPR) repeat protein
MENRLRSLPIFLIFFVIFFAACSTNRSDTQKDSVTPLLDGMGTHTVEVAARSSAKKYFNQGLVLAYGFNHSLAEKSFLQGATLDPECAMCFWGAGLVLGPHINAPMRAEDNLPARERVLQGLAVAKVPRERAYLEALLERYPTERNASADKSYAAAMKKLMESDPEDSDAATLYAEALMDLHPWDLWEKNGKAKEWTPEIISVLERALAIDGNHPGANHLYIHAVEASGEPERGIVSADRLRTLVPGAGHLVHMPAHIYMRVGRYHDASLANEAAINADDATSAGCHGASLYSALYRPHNHNFLWASATMEGRREKVLTSARTAAEMVDMKLMSEPGYGALQHFLMLPAYSLVKFGLWQEVLSLPEPPASLPYPRGVVYFAKGAAYVRTGKRSEAERELQKLRKTLTNPAVRKVTIWDLNTADHLLKIAERLLTGELAASKSNFAEATSAMEQAVKLEDSLNYDEPRPWLNPVRHHLGAVLLDAGRFAEAEKIYLADLKQNPGNGWSLFGLLQAQRLQGKDASETERLFRAVWSFSDITLTRSAF